MNWTDAEDFCRTKSAHLASVTSSAENEYILEGRSNGGIYHLWIGGSDLEEEGVWKWADCSPWNFTYWRSGEPNNFHGAQDCINYHPEDRKWDDYQCNSKARFVCRQRKICHSNSNEGISYLKLSSVMDIAPNTNNLRLHSLYCLHHIQLLEYQMVWRDGRFDITQGLAAASTARPVFIALVKQIPAVTPMAYTALSAYTASEQTKGSIRVRKTSSACQQC